MANLGFEVIFAPLSVMLSRTATLSFVQVDTPWGRAKLELANTIRWSTTELIVRERVVEAINF